MATNLKYDHPRLLPLAVSDPSSPVSGDPVRFGQLVGVAVTSKGDGGNASTDTTVDQGPAVYNLSVKAADGNGNVAVAVGDRLYYVDADTPKISKKEAGYFFGIALEAITSGSTATIMVEIGTNPGGGVANLAKSAKRHTAKSRLFNVDNGSGTTLDDVLIRPSTAITITAARVVVTTENFGTVNAATVQVGVAVGGATLVAVVGLTNSLAVGAKQDLALAAAAVAANTPVIVRHTGLATTVAGEYYVEIEYTID